MRGRLTVRKRIEHRLGGQSCSGAPLRPRNRKSWRVQEENSSDLLTPEGPQLSGAGRRKWSDIPPPSTAIDRGARPSGLRRCKPIQRRVDSRVAAEARKQAFRPVNHDVRYSYRLNVAIGMRDPQAHAGAHSRSYRNLDPHVHRATCSRYDAGQSAHDRGGAKRRIARPSGRLGVPVDRRRDRPRF